MSMTVFLNTACCLKATSSLSLSGVNHERGLHRGVYAMALFVIPEAACCRLVG